MSEYILKTTNLTKTYKGYHAVNNVSIALEPGKIYGLVGRNGAGKSTLMRLIAGLSYPSSGEIELFGHTKESEIQIDITNCHDAAITIDKWKELNIKKMRNEMKKKISIECLNYNMEFKKDDNKNNFLTYMWENK